MQFPLASGPDRTTARLVALVDELLRQPAEAEWLEFKRDNDDAAMIGQRISALSNAARLADRDCAYILWGIADGTHAVVGTSFEPSAAKRQNQPLAFWLAQRLNPSPAFAFHHVPHPHGRVVLLEIPADSSLPVQFDGKAYIRVGSATPALREFPEREKALLAKLRPFVWEQGAAASFLTDEEVLELLDFDAYLALLGLRVPETRRGVVERMAEDRLIASDAGGRWTILNIGAVLLARRLDRFDTLARKALRIIQYEGSGKLLSKPEQAWMQGYAAGFEQFLTFLQGVLPGRETIGTFRVVEEGYPPEAIKELLANALIHQDMTIGGTGPMVEVFEDRIEFSNPGDPVTDMRKLFRAAPRSRNEKLAGMMRRMRLCEERGMGLRKVIAATDRGRFPPPDIRYGDGSTRVVLYAPRRGFNEMDKAERVRACYQHAALLHEGGQRLTNTSLRDRFGPGEVRVDAMSRVIRDCVEAGLIRVADPSKPKSGYLPYWA